MSYLPICILMFSIVLLLFIVLKLKIHAFLSLLIVSVFLGIATGMPMSSILNSMTAGMSSTLGFVATVVGIGAIFGQVLEASGGAESLARFLLVRFGRDKAPYSLAITGFLVAIPVFLDVGFIILAPVLYALSKDTKKSLLCYAIPLLAGLAVTHAFIPPTPGPVAVAEIINVDLGWLIFFGFIIGIPVTLIAGPLYGKYIGNKMHVDVPDIFKEPDEMTVKKLPSFWLIAGIIVIPLALIVSNTVSTVWAKENGMESVFWVQLLTFLGHPFIALLIATMISIYVIGIRRGFTPSSILDVSTKALAPAGLIILITGAGGVFKQLLIDSGIGVALAESLSGSVLPPIVLAYLLALIVRVTQGSATVAMITSAGIMSPLLEAYTLSEPHKALIVIAIASGATALSHVNDSGFWLVGKYLGMNEKQTLRSWTVMETIISVAGFSLSLGLSFFF
ncbi:MAG: GntP family permease [Tannerella sp.]|nr:GntP family permease [Tannerella sp.]